MIVLETSAIMAVMLRESEAEAVKRVLGREDVTIPASCVLEGSLSARRSGLRLTIYDAFIASRSPTILPLDERQAAIAIAADRRYGRATGHPAQLTFDDCMAYAAAVALDAPLLFKGDDFALTDVRRAEV
jgi:ribonuclease VapC